MTVCQIPAMDYGVVEREICRFIRKEANGRGVVLGVSGGVDSAVVAALAVEALGNEKVFALMMPETGTTPAADTKDALELVKKLRIRHATIDIAEASQKIIEATERSGNRLAEGNAKARIRMVFLYYFANLEGRIVLGSGDRSELLIGYFTKYGDGGADILPIGGLYKSQVRGLAKRLGIPERIAVKKSSPRLWPDHMAEKELGLGYDEIDLLLHLIVDKKLSPEQVLREVGQESRANVEKIVFRVKENAHKLKVPPVAKISTRAVNGKTHLGR